MFTKQNENADTLVVLLKAQACLHRCGRALPAGFCGICPRNESNGMVIACKSQNNSHNDQSGTMIFSSILGRNDVWLRHWNFCKQACWTYYGIIPPDSFMIYLKQIQTASNIIKWQFPTLQWDVYIILAPEKLDETRQLAVQDQSSWAQDAWDENPGWGNTPPTTNDIPRRSSTKYNRYVREN